MRHTNNVLKKHLWVLLIIGLTSGCGGVPIGALLFSDYERTLDAYAQTDTTETSVDTFVASDGREVTLLSAFFGLDDELPGLSDRFICEGSGNKDGMPVIFSHEIDAKTIEPGDFKITQASGAIGEVTCLTMAPADDVGEIRTALLVGQYGSAEDQPVTVEIVGNILTADGSANFKGTSVAVTPLEDGPSIVWAEQVPRDQWKLDQVATTLPFGGGSGCPDGTKQILRVTWNGGITKPGGRRADDEERKLYRVEVATGPERTQLTITPFALADVGDGDNNHKLCLDTTDEVLSVTFAAGAVTDPREDLNSQTGVVLSELP